MHESSLSSPSLLATHASSCPAVQRDKDTRLELDEEVVNINQAVTKDLTSSSKFSGSCVLTLQTLPIDNYRGTTIKKKNMNGAAQVGSV